MLPRCAHCGGTVLPRHDVFEPDHDACTMCGREPGLEPVRFMPDAKYILLPGERMNAGGRHQCPTCLKYVNIRRRTCIVCGDFNPWFQP